jgi:hypothetical protein
MRDRVVAVSQSCAIGTQALRVPDLFEISA